MKHLVDYSKKEKNDSETLEGVQRLKQLNPQIRSKRSDDSIKLPENFKVEWAIADGNCFFDSFRQGLEQQLGIKVTVAQLRQHCREFAQNNPPEWFINAIHNSHDNNGVVRKEGPDSYVVDILKDDRWGDSEVEGRILCKKYGVKLHIVESNLLHASDTQQDQFLHQLIDNSGSKSVGEHNKIDYGDSNIIHIINRGNAHFQPILRIQETQYNGRKSRDKSIPSYESPREYLALSKSSNKPSIPSAPYSNDSIVPHPDEFRAKNNIHIVSCKQQDDTHNCGFSALENAEAILNAVKDGNYDPAKVKESLKAVNKDVESSNTLRKYFANSLKKVSPINKQSSVAFSSSSEESIEQRPLQNAENIPRENDRSITSQKRPGEKDDVKLHQKCVVLCEKLEEQVPRKLKEISSKYILTDKKKENELSNFIKLQKKCKKGFYKLWGGFVSLSDEEKKKAILRIFFFAEFWDSSQDENEGAFRNIVWNKLCELNAQDYIFKESVDYLIPFVSNPLVSMRMYKNNNRLQRVLRRAKSSLLNDEMCNLIIKICIETFNMRNTFNRGEFIKSGKVVECLSALKKFCEAGRKNKIADFELGDDQDCKIIYSLLGKKSKLNISSAIRSLIEEITLKKTEEKENTLEGFINDLHKSKKDLTQIYQCDQIKGFLKQYDYYLITFAIDEVIQYNESPLEEVLSIAKDHFSEEEMNAMLERACKYIVDQRNKSVEGVAFDSEKAFRLLSDKLNSINRKKEEILKFLVDKLGKIQDFSENCQSSTLQQTLEEVVSYSPSRGKNTGNRNHESCSKNFFDELTMILDGGKTDKQDKIQSFISSRLSRYKGNCFYRLLLGEFLFENQDHAQISQKYLLLHLDSQSIAFLLTAGQREKAKTTVLSIIDKSRGPVPNISSFAIDYRNLQIVNLEIDPRKSHLLDGIKKEDIEQGYKIKFIPINEEVISFDLLRKAIKDVGSRKQVIDNLKNIVNFINYIFNLDNDKIKFSFIRDESDAKNLVDGLLMGSKHEIPPDDKIINEIISSLVKNNIQAKSNNIRDHRLPIADKRSGKKDKKKAEYYAYLSREYGIFSSQANVRGDRATFNRSAIRKNRKRPIINEEDYGCNALHLAIADNKIDNVKKLIGSNGEYVKGQDCYGNTPLHFAVQKNNLEIFKALMNYIAVNDKEKNYVVAKNDDGCTPLHFAAKSGNVEVVKELLECVGTEAKEDYVKSKNNKGETPLHFAARSSNVKAVERLLECVGTEAKEDYVKSKNNKGETPLHFAARSSNVKAVERLLEYVNNKEGYVRAENNNKCTPLHFAAGSGNVEVVKKLLQYVNNEERYVQSANNQGDTPLHFAAKKRDNVGVILNLIECVTEKENYVKRTNKLLYTPLHFAAKFGDVEVINKLLECVGTEAKEDYVKSKNNKGETPLHFAARSGNVKAVERLLEYVNNKEGYVRAENNEKETSLHFAARSDNVKAVERLLEYVNNKEGYVRAENNEKETSLHFAAESGNVEVINKLLECVDKKERKGCVQSKSNKGETPLHFAAKSDNVKAVERLLEFVGKNEKENYIAFANNDNKNALDIAISYGNCKVFYELLKYIKNPEQEQHYLDLAEQASDSEKRNIHSSDNLQTKGCVKERKKPRNSDSEYGGTSEKNASRNLNNIQPNSENQEIFPRSPNASESSVEQENDLEQDDTIEEHSEQSCNSKQYNSSRKEVINKGENIVNKGPRISDGSTVNTLNENGDTLLHLAIYENNLETVKFLVEKGANVNTLDKDGNTSLHLAIYENNLETVKFLVEKGANVNTLDKDGNTPLHFAVKVRNLETVKFLVEKGADVNTLNKDGNTPLRLSLNSPFLNWYVVEFLVEKGANVNTPNENGDTPLHLAIYENNLETVKFLVEKGANVNTLDKDGNTPLHFAVKVRNLETVKFLVEKGADVNTLNKDGNTPLRLSLNSPFLNWYVVEFLVEKGANVNTLDKDGNTPLHLAIYENNLETVKFLVEKGANVNTLDKDGNTPLHLAIYENNLETVKFLVEKGANVNTLDKDGNTPLHFAVKVRNKEMFKILIEAGADRKAVAEINKTPFSFLVNALDIGTPSPVTTLNNVALDNQLRKRSLSF